MICFKLNKQSRTTSLLAQRIQYSSSDTYQDISFNSTCHLTLTFSLNMESQSIWDVACQFLYIPSPIGWFDSLTKLTLHNQHVSQQYPPLPYRYSGEEKQPPRICISSKWSCSSLFTITKSNFIFMKMSQTRTTRMGNAIYSQALHHITLWHFLFFFRSPVVVCQVSPSFQYTFPISPNFNSIPLSLPFLLQELGSGHNINRLMQISNLLNTLQKCHRNEASAMPINSPYSWIYSGCLSETRRVLGNELALTKAKFCGWNWNCGQCFIFMPHFWPVLYRRLPRPIPSQILVVILSKFI